MHIVDLNCDMGESFGAYKMGQDEEILTYVTSANIACGYHAGDPSTMRETVKKPQQTGSVSGRIQGCRIFKASEDDRWTFLLQKLMI